MCCRIFLQGLKNEMKRIIFLSLILIQPLFLLSFENETLQSLSGVVFDFRYRALEPGEIIMVFMTENSTVKKAVIRFLEKEFLLVNRGVEWEPQAFIGLDLAIKPGSYLMKVYVEKIDGAWEILQKEFQVKAKEFPVKKLWLEERYVTPPPTELERIRRESEILDMVYSVVTPHWLGRGRFIMPCQGEVSPNFGERRIYNNRTRSSHSGIDISSSQGSPVKASNSGMVVLASNLYFSGLTVIIDHGLGLFTLYCHFSKIKVRRGQLVMKGDVVGEIGATGRVTGPHLHWAVKLLGSRIDPFALIALPFD